MRLPVCLLFVLLTACVYHGHGLRNRATAEAALEQAPLPKDRLKRQALLRHVLRSGLWTMVENGKELAPILFGTGPNSINHIWAQEEGKPGCDKSDGLVAQTALVNWEAKLEKFKEEIVEEMLPVLTNMSASMGPAGPSLGDMWKAQKMAVKVSKHLVRQIPNACRTVGTGPGDAWSDMISCMHQATNVSKRCLRCVPRFFKQMNSECLSGCEHSMMDTANEVANKLEPMVSKVIGGGLEDQDQVFEIAQTMLGSFKTLVPCFQCFRAKTDTLMDCFSLEDSWKEDVDAAFQGLIDDLKNGNLTATIPMMGDAPTQPPVPLA